jgi:hypothetical protein
MDILDKVAKLLALAHGKGTTPAEAATAAAQAQRLMLKHNIAQADLEQQETSIETSTLWQGGRVVRWKLNLAGGLARLNGCRALVYSAVRAHQGAKIIIVGSESNAAVVRYLFTYLVREIGRLTQNTRHDDAEYAGVSLKAYRSAFRKGAVNAVLGKLRVSREVQRREAQVFHSKALMRIDTHNQKVQKIADTLSNGGHYARSTSKQSYLGHSAGFRAGKNIAIKPGLTQ